MRARQDKLSTRPTTGFISGSDPDFPPPEGSPRRTRHGPGRRWLYVEKGREPLDAMRPFECPKCGRMVNPDEGLKGVDCWSGLKAWVCPWCFDLMGVEKSDRGAGGPARD